MRTIRKQPEPRNLTEWRARYQSDPNFGYELIDAELRSEIREALVAEQGGLCAYTGRHISAARCHIEHPIPQKHCERGEGVSYGNMLACVPAPNDPGLPYGAQKKGSWPARDERPSFVSPLQAGCQSRFSFTVGQTDRGLIRPSDPDDTAAALTIEKLGLNHPSLTSLRRDAIEKTLELRGRGPASLRVDEARRRIAQMRAAEQNGGVLEPFCFVLEQALEWHIRRVAAIRRSRSTGRS